MKTIKFIFNWLFVMAIFMSLSLRQAPAQQVININEEKSVNLLRSQTKQENIINDFFGKSVQSRQFDFNSQLKSLTNANKGDVLLLDFFVNRQYHAEIQSVTRSYDGVLSISAKIKESNYGFCYISISESGILINADLPESDESFMAAKGKNGTYLSEYKISEMNQKVLPCEGILPPKNNDEPTLRAYILEGQETLPGSLSGCGSAELNSPIQIDVLVVYTAAAAQWASSSSTGIDNVINTAIGKSNQAMINSETNITFNLVYKYQTDYTELDTSDDLYNLKNTGDGAMDEVHALRKQYQADLVMLISKIEEVGGLGYVLNSENGRPDIGFAYSRVQQVAWTTTMVHEIGHNMGCTHHELQGGSGLYPYSFGYRGAFPGEDNRFSTIMTYTNFDGPPNYPGIDYFSDPGKIIDGTAIGTSTANNVLTLKRTKRLISLNSDIINTALTNLTVSEGILSPAFDPDIANYSVTVGNTVTSIGVTGIANYNCATVTGNVDGKSLNLGTNTVNVTVKSHNNAVQRTYTVVITRLTTACGTYESMPLFDGDVSALAGSDALDLNMNIPPLPVIMHSSLNIDEITQTPGPVIIRENSSSNNCYNFGGYYNIYQGNVQIFKVTKTGNYIFTHNSSGGSDRFLTIFNSETVSCSSFVTSSAYWAGSGTSTYMPNAITVSLTANTGYYLRTTSYSAVAPWTISVSGPGDLYSEFTIPAGMNYTYIAINQSDNKIKAQNTTADFRTLAPGIYSVYGIPYKTADSDPATFVGKSLSEIQNSDCVTPSMTSIVLTIGAPVYIWTPDGSHPIDWTYAGNWDPNGVPDEYSSVIIPKRTSYPVLSAPASADKVFFAPDAELGRQDYLTYNKAHVALDFGSTGLKREKWHLLTMPINKVVSGDFSFGGYPYTYLRKFEITTVSEETYQQAGWTPYSSNNEELTIGEGFALWINDGSAGSKGKSDTGSGIDALISSDSRDYGLGRVNGIIELPYFENQVVSDAHRIHKYENGKSIFYTMNTSSNDLPLVDNTSQFERGDEAYKLALAGLSPASPLNVPVCFGADNDRYFALVGNPFMSTIDFQAFCTANSDIKKSYQIWTGSGFSSYGYAGESGIVNDNVTLTQYIAPMQAFFVEKSSAYSGAGSLTFNIADISASGNPAVLRSSPVVDPFFNKLDITASNDQYKVLTYIARKEYGSSKFSDVDSRKIIPGMSDVPEIYTLKDSEKGKIAVGSNIINSDILVPLGLATAYKGNLHITFSGMDKFNSSITFIDLINGMETDLTGMKTYEYSFDYVPKKSGDEIKAEESRFLIRIQNMGTGLKTVEELASVYASGHAIYAVSSASNPIQRIEIYNLQGKLLYNEKSINATYRTITLGATIPEICIVRLVTEQGVQSIKLFMNK
jgi:hypothetical protein